MALGDDATAPCELMLFEDGRFWCKLVLVEQMAGMEPLIAKALVVGGGCHTLND